MAYSIRHVITGCAALAFGAVAQAVTVRPPSFTELVGSADIIVKGNVTALEYSVRTVDGKPVPFTHVTLSVNETLKGPASPRLVLHLLGGTVGGRTVRVGGAPALAVGDRGFFFVQNNGTQFFPLVRVGHGLYRTMWDDFTKTERVLRADYEPLRSVAEVSAALEMSHTRPTARRVAAETLTSYDFVRHIREEVERHAR